MPGPRWGVTVAEPDGVLLGESTYLLLRDAVRAETIEPVIAKGKAQPLRASRLLEVLTGAQGIARHLDSPLVGRTRERALLADALARAVDDEGVHLRSRRRGAAAGRPVGRGRRLGGSASVRRR